MSDDTYYVIRRTPGGKFVACVGHASDTDEPSIQPGVEYTEYDSPLDALAWASRQNSEYGASMHPECGNLKMSKSKDS